MTVPSKVAAEEFELSRCGAFGASVGAIAMMGVILFKAHPSIVELLIVFCVPLAVILG
jgi:hypothetical protein